jgi:hypothetical protein
VTGKTTRTDLRLWRLFAGSEAGLCTRSTRHSLAQRFLDVASSRSAKHHRQVYKKALVVARDTEKTRTQPLGAVSTATPRYCVRRTREIINGGRNLSSKLNAPTAFPPPSQFLSRNLSRCFRAIKNSRRPAPDRHQWLAYLTVGWTLSPGRLALWLCKMLSGNWLWRFSVACGGTSDGGLPCVKFGVSDTVATNAPDRAGPFPIHYRDLRLRERLANPGS